VERHAASTALRNPLKTCVGYTERSEGSTQACTKHGHSLELANPSRPRGQVLTGRQTVQDFHAVPYTHIAYTRQGQHVDPA